MIEHASVDQRDPLTGAVTGSAMCCFLQAALDLSEPQGPAVAVLAVGIDKFADLLARHGRAVTDALLLGMADRLRAGLRGHDLVGQLPEGFTICLPEVFSSPARLAAERLQRTLEADSMPTPVGPIPLRCSVGLALGRGQGVSGSELIDRAVIALAMAQQAGGSRVMADAG
jgi:diguanylate cyclase (GGDEF)-like protein